MASRRARLTAPCLCSCETNPPGHLGYSKWDYTPTKRGFDSYLGYMQGETDYYNKSSAEGKAKHGVPPLSGYDFWRNRSIIPADDSYTMSFYSAEAERLVQRWGEAATAAAAAAAVPKPWFLYYALQTVHTPLEAPPQPEHMENCAHVTSSAGRKTLCSMASALDAEVGRFIADLKAKQLWDSTVLWVVSDNGGMVDWNGGKASFSSNFPFRGGKATLFEGGVRAVSLVNGGSALLPDAARGTVRDDLVHAVDIPATLAGLGGATQPAGSVDGIDQWDTIATGTKGARQEIPVNVYPHCKEKACRLASHDVLKGATYSALIQGDWKLISPWTGLYDGYSTNEDQGAAILPPPANDTSTHLWRLFNLTADPREMNDVAAVHPDVVKAMQARLDVLGDPANGYYDPTNANRTIVKAGEPSANNNTWAPWE
jgi:arylsulfatase A-like enzyme